MARIAGVNLPNNKRIEFGLTYIFGVGRSLAAEIIEWAGVSPDIHAKDLTEKEIASCVMKWNSTWLRATCGAESLGIFSD